MRIEIRYQVLLLDEKETHARALSKTVLEADMNACKLAETKTNKLKRSFPEAEISKINKGLKSVKKL